MPKPSKKKPEAVKSQLEIFPHGEDDGQVEQGSELWHKMHIGVPSASLFSTIMATGKDGGESKTRTKLLFQMAGEVLTGIPRENYSDGYMERGKKMEERARSHYAFTHDVELTRIGFIRNKLPHGQMIGCSPDALVGKSKGLEIKTQAPHLMIEQLIKGSAMPTEHRAQVHGTMLVAELDEMDLMLFYDGMPVSPKFTIGRDEAYCKEIAGAVEIFGYELASLVEKIRGMGGAPRKKIAKPPEEIPR